MTNTLKDGRFVGAFTAIVTPFTADGSAIDSARLAKQIEFQAKGEDGRGGVRGIIVSGTTGESPTLEDDEYEHLLATAVEEAHKHGLLVIAGTGSNSTAHAIYLQDVAEGAGADAFLSVNPYYNKPTQEGLYRHFMTLAEGAGLPIMLYNIPGRTGVALSSVTVERLAAHPRIVATKEATGSVESCGEIAMKCPTLAVLSGDDALTLPFMSVGAVGVVSVASNLLPGTVAGLVRAAHEGRFADALVIHRRLAELCRALFLETNPIPLKSAMRLLGRDTGAMRLPMCDAGDVTVGALRKALSSVGLLGSFT